MESGGVIEVFFICFGGLIGSILCYNLHLGIGIYALIGIILGPSLLNCVSLSYLSSTLSTIGILFVLFEIGLHLSYEKILVLRKYIPNSILAIALSIFCVNGFLLYFVPFKAALLLSMLICISSTPVVYQILVNTKKLYTKIGRLVFTTMILQDILSIILLVNHKNTHSILFTIVSTVAILTLLFLVGSKIVNKIFKKISDSFHFILFVAFIIIVGLSIITDYMGLSSELGAVLAGFLLAETDYKEYIEGEIANIKEVLLAVFFMSVGMYLPTTFLLQHWPQVLIILASVLGLKFFGIVVGSRILLLNNIQSITAGLMLLSVGEPVFIFVSKILPDMVSSDVSNYLILVTVLSIIISPILFKIFFQFYHKKIDLKNKHINEYQQFIIVGCNDVTQLIIRILHENHIDYMAIDNDVSRVNAYKNKGYHIKLTDYKDTGTLVKIIKKANGIFFSYIPANLVIHEAIKNSKKSIFIKVKDIKEEEKYKALGLIPIRIDMYDEAYKVCSKIMPEFGIDESEIEKIFISINEE